MSAFGVGLILIVGGTVVNIAGIVAEWEFGDLLGQDIAVIPLSGFALGALIIGFAAWIGGILIMIHSYNAQRSAKPVAPAPKMRAHGSPSQILFEQQVERLKSAGITIMNDRVKISGGTASQLATEEANYLLTLRRAGYNQAADAIIIGRVRVQLAAELKKHSQRMEKNSSHKKPYDWAIERLESGGQARTDHDRQG